MAQYFCGAKTNGLCIVILNQRIQEESDCFQVPARIYVLRASYVATSVIGHLVTSASGGVGRCTPWTQPTGSWSCRSESSTRTKPLPSPKTSPATSPSWLISKLRCLSHFTHHEASKNNHENASGSCSET